MREIKFRAWNGGAMEYGGFSIHATGGISGLAEGLTRITEQSPIMQYTGLKDKNGKEIYEGDIVRVDWNDSRYDPVVGLWNGMGEKRNGHLLVGLPPNYLGAMR